MKKIKKQIKKIKKQNGITLLNLVVTIIILLILVGVTLDLTLGNTGLFKRVQKALEKYETESHNETNKISDMDRTIEKIEKDERTDLKIGDIVNYTYDDAAKYELKVSDSGYGNYEKTDTGYKLKVEEQKNQLIGQVKGATWKILNINDDNSVDLVCTSIAENGSSYYTQIHDGVGIEEANQYGAVDFGGALGYSNGVYILNDICAKQYSNESLKITARSIRLEDIEKFLNDKGQEEKKNFMDKYGTKEYEGENAYYPKIFYYENGSEIDENTLITNRIGYSDSTTSSLSIPIHYSDTDEGYGKAEKTLKVKCNFYGLDTTYFKDKIQTLFNTNSSFWVASRYAYGDDERSLTRFGIRAISTQLSGYDLFHSSSRALSAAMFICPVVTIDSNFKLVKNTSDDSWNIEK